MEGAGKEYLERHHMDNKFWIFLETCLRSNADPHGIMLSQAVFYVCFPVLLAVLAWGVWSGLKQLAAAQGKK
jgi:hypothetical protein